MKSTNLMSRETKRNVFRKTNKPRKISFPRQIVEFLFLLTISVILFIFLNSLPIKYDFLSILTEIINSLYTLGIVIVSLLKNILILAGVFGLVLACLILFLSSIIRLFKLSTRALNYYNKYIKNRNVLKK
tara:strand:- start:47 stop:436 length:390 start_codon:yes stop_codon:yes gene_type:complete